MALDQKFFKKSTAATGLADQEQGLFIYADANDVDSYDGDGDIWYDITKHEVNIPLADKASNLVLNLDGGTYTSGTWKDQTTNTNNASLNGNATYNSDTRGYFTLDGTGDYLQIADHSSLNLGAATYEMWFRQPSYIATEHLVGRYESSNFDFFIRTSGSSGAIETAFYDGSSQIHSNIISANSAYTANEWSHVAVTLAGNTSGSAVKLYVNGTLQATQNLTGNRITDAAANLYLGILGSGYTTQYEFTGDIGTTRIYNVALTAAEVAQNFRAGNFINYSSVITSKPQATQDSLVTVPPTQGTLHTSNLQMNLLGSAYSSGTTWTDSSGNGNNGAITGTPEYTNRDGNGDYLSFDGDPRLTVSSFSELQSATAFTIELWLRSSTATNDGMIWNVYDSSSSTRKFSLSWNQSKFRWVVYSASGGYDASQDLFTTNTVSANIWYHVVATYNYDTEMKIYVDSVLEGAEASPNLGVNTTTTTQMRWGDRSDGYGVNTQIGQARFYNAALTSTQVYTNYNATKDLYKGATSLQLHLDANGYSSGAWADSSGNSRNGAITDAVHTNDNNSDYFTFDGATGSSGDKVVVTHTTDLNADQDFSVELWAWRNDDTDHSLISKGTGSASWDISFGASSGFGYQFNNYSGSATVRTGTGDFTSANRWEHIVVTYDTGTKKPDFFIDGVLRVGHTHNAGSSPSGNSGDLIIGGYYSYPVRHGWNGRIAQVRFYKGKLTQDQVKTNYNATKALYQNPTIKMHLDAGDDSTVTATTWSDKVNSNNGTFTNFPSTLADFYDEEVGNFVDFVSGDKVIVSGSDLNPANTKSIEVWFNADSTSGSRYIISNWSGSGNNYGYHFYIYNGTLMAWVYSQAQNAYFINLQSGGTVTAGKWHHAVLTIGSSASNNRIYLDGKLTQTASSTSGTFPTTAAHNGITIGAYGSANTYDGKIGLVKTYDTQLTTQQVVQNYLATKNKYPSGNNFSLLSSPVFQNSSTPYYFRFDAGADKAEVTSVDIDISMGFTVSIYIKRHATTSGYQHCFRLTGTGYTNYLFAIFSYNNQVYYDSAGTGNTFSTFNLGLGNDDWTDNSGAWRNVIFTRENTAGSTTNRGEVYENGVSLRTQTNLSEITNITNVYVNRNASSASATAKVDVGLIKIWQRPFSDAEALAEYNATKSIYGL